MSHQTAFLGNICDIFHYYYTIRQLQRQVWLPTDNHKKPSCGFRSNAQVAE